jgi:spermidine synthase
VLRYKRFSDCLNTLYQTLPSLPQRTPLTQVLVIGGGDGGVLREVCKHESVESVTLVEIDECVLRVAKKYLPAMAAGFQHPKVNVHIGDGFAYLKENTNTYDVIITDSSDPVGPAEALFGESFYALMKNALLPGGIICTQGKSARPSISPAMITDMHAPRLGRACPSMLSLIHYKLYEPLFPTSFPFF